MLSQEDHAIVSRARDYPYPIPQASFLYSEHGPQPFDAAACENRTPVLAIGSNQSPIRLGQKFGHDARHRIPVQRAALADFDVVYSAHVTAYGSVPAMLQTSPGTKVTLAITWLDSEQLEIMNRSELISANYHLANLNDLTLDLDTGERLSSMYAYVSRRGHLRGPDGDAMSLRAIPCEGRRRHACHTFDALEVVRRRVAPDASPEGFILRLVRDRGFRARVTDQMSADAVPFAHPIEIVA